MPRERIIPLEHVDRAVLLVERYGTAEDKAALSEAINILRRIVDHTDRVAQRKAIIDIANSVRQRRSTSESQNAAPGLPARQPITSNAVVFGETVDDIRRRLPGCRPPARSPETPGALT